MDISPSLIVAVTAPSVRAFMVFALETETLSVNEIASLPRPVISVAYTNLTLPKTLQVIDVTVVAPTSTVVLPARVVSAEAETLVSVTVIV